MDIKIIKDDKEGFEVEIPSVTIAEILRVYLNQDSNVDFAAWKREHPTKKPLLSVKGKNPKKSLKDAVSSITKDLDKIEKDFKSMN